FLIVGDVDEDVMESLQFFASTSDGFEIAEYDMKARGPGELLGLRQHGLPAFKVADLIEDHDVLMQARVDEMELLSEEEDEKKYSYILERIKILYGERLRLLEVG
ncbi:MAG: DNA helicase RecG, partial [Thermotoga sp.]